MDVDTFNHYSRGADVLEAQETLRAVETAAYPYGKKQHRQKFYKDVRKLVKIIDDTEPVGMEDFAKHLQGMIHG